MKKKLETIPYASVQAQRCGENVKIGVTKDMMHKGHEYVFYVPLSSTNQHGFVPDTIIKSRMKHDFNIEVGHISYCNIPRKETA